MGGSSTASAPSSPLVPTTARAEIRKRQNRDSARRSREKRKSHLRGVAESVEMQSRRVRELDARVAQLEALVHKAVKHPIPPNPPNPAKSRDASNTNTNANPNAIAHRRVDTQQQQQQQQQSIPIPIPSIPNVPSTRNHHHQIPSHPHAIPTMPAPSAPFYPSIPSATASANAQHFLPSSLLGCIPPVPVTPSANSALPISVSTPFASAHPPQSALAFALDPWSMPSEPLVSSAGPAPPVSSTPAIISSLSTLSSSSPSILPTSSPIAMSHPHPHHATNALDPYMGDV